MTFKRLLVAGILGILWGGPAYASLYNYSDRPIFESMGTVLENYGFEDFGPYPVNPGDPWNTHGVTYSSQQNTVFFGSLGSKPPAVSHVLISNYWLNISGSLDANVSYTMLGFDLAVLFPTAVPGNTTLSIFTNQATYVYQNLGQPDVSVSQKFFGFVSTESEFINGFDLTSDTWGTAPALDNVTLGVAATSVPLPSAAWLFGSGLTTLVAGLARRPSRCNKLRGTA